MGRRKECEPLGLLLYPLVPRGELVLIAILMQTASQLIVWMAAFVPAKIGVLEGGNAGLFELASAPEL